MIREIPSSLFSWGPWHARCFKSAEPPNALARLGGSFNKKNKPQRTQRGGHLCAGVPPVEESVRHKGKRV
jgi:hypothetical protein